MPNRLIHETSPYLLQHAHNPVDWYPWGPEALARARDEDKPILLSIGYSACHWCHVMERESFEDEAIAQTMNRDFVCIKVDREERPDLDEIYMRATQAMNQGQGGWPMTVFLTPEQRPFFAGTYFPPADKFGRPGFPTVLGHVARVWRERRDAVVGQAARLTELLQAEAKARAPLQLTLDDVRGAASAFRREFDPEWGGFGHAPKFPPATAIELLLRIGRRFGDDEARAMALKTLVMMARGGMYDQIGGGFCRYSTDERWLVPHFEKMLYDNALLARAYLAGFQVSGDAFFRRIAVETLDYVLREMQSPAGGFYSATDADSEGVEGKFFVWTPEEVRAAVGDEEEARRLGAWLDVSEEGNWEGHSIPNTPRPLDEVARDLGISAGELARSIEAGRPKLYAAREKRVHPGLDDKVLTAWNGMMAGALAEGYRVLGEPRFLDGARRAAEFLLAAMARPDGGLYRTWRNGRAHLDAVLEDYAFLAEALIDLYEAGGDERWLAEARRIAGRMRADFADEESGAFFTTAAGHEPLIVRHREAMDGATPSGNAVAASVLARLAFHEDRAELRGAAVRAVEAFGKIAARHPRAFARSLAVVDFLAEGPTELAYAGDATALARAVAAVYLPNHIVAFADGKSQLPLAAGKTAVDGKPALYICRNYACAAPITDPAAVAAALAAPSPSPPPRRRARGATAEATAAHAARLGPHATTKLGTTGLTVARIGFGGYRVDDSDPDHAEALGRALASGINLIDTSTNYTDGGSERMIGEVVATLDREGVAPRDAVVVVTKAGYVQGQNLRLARTRDFPEMVKYMDGCWHCIHPEWLADQLARSLARLAMDRVDVLLLHNPEYFFSDAAHRGATGPLAALRDEFYRRVRAAFAWLEGEVAGGRIGCYGVSSNTVAHPDDDPEATSLARFLDAARDAGGAGHHFRVLQLPLNLMEGEGRAVAAAARDAGLGVLANRPLNAIRGRGLVRLADVTPGSEGMDPERQARTAAWAREALDPRLPVERRGEPLQRKALWALASTPGVSCVLLGMRRPAYVDDAVAVLGWPPLDEVEPLYRALG